jgi:uncharacterized protein (TIGR02001 family)
MQQLVKVHQINYKGVSIMKRIIVCMAAVLALSMGSVASAEDKVTGDVYVGPVSKYVFRGYDYSGGKGVIQGGVDLSYKGFTVSYWTNYQTITAEKFGLKAGETTETDITLNYSFTPVEILTLNVGNIYYNLDGQPTSSPSVVEDTNEVYLKATLNTLLSPTFAVYYDWDKATKTGLFYTLSVGHTFTPMKNLGISLGALASYNMQNPNVSESYNNLHNYELTASADYSINDSIKITPNYLYSNSFNATARVKGGITDQSVVGIKATLLF